MEWAVKNNNNLLVDLDDSEGEEEEDVHYNLESGDRVSNNDVAYMENFASDRFEDDYENGTAADYVVDNEELSSAEEDSNQDEEGATLYRLSDHVGVPRGSLGGVGGCHASPALREDEQFCELSPCRRHGGARSSLSSQSAPLLEASLDEADDPGGRHRHPGHPGQPPPAWMAPERAPPIVDFLMVLTAFIVAVVAAYLSISADVAN